ncbi:preprotein translocase subunit SecG [candidate division WWE3 bacterium]|nr:preprotein translocase subunit SecG [candidate division WWE3 bacterium]
MNLLAITKVLQFILSVFIIILVLIQSKGTGLARSFSGFSSFYRTRRGLEKFIFILTIVLSIAFVANSLTLVLLS